MDLSIVIPVLNEENNIKQLIDRIENELISGGLTYEIIFIDDVSTDNSYKIINQINEHNPLVKGIQFSRRFGYQESIFCGLENSAGEYVITMDSDLQHPPELLGDMVKKAEEGYDIVNMVRKKNAGNSLIKRLCSNLFYKFINFLSPTPLVNESADFRLYSRKVVDTIKEFPERRLFIRGLVGWMGFNQTEIKYEEGVRTFGKSKFNFFRLIHFALQGITAFSTKPLFFAIYIGFIFTLFGFLYGIWIIINVFLLEGYLMQGWPTIVCLLLFIGGLIMMLLGIIGIYMSVLFTEIKNRPRYIINKLIGFNIK